METPPTVTSESAPANPADQSQSSDSAKKRAFVPYVPGIIFLVLGIVMLTTETPKVTTAFGADFYTEVYRAAADVAVVCKFGFGFVLIGLGADRICKAFLGGRS